MSSQHHHALEQDEVRQRLAVALDSAGIGSWELDVDSEVLIADARTLELFGFPADSRETRLSEFSRLVPRAHRLRVGETLTTSMSEGSDYAEEYPVRQPDGSLRWIAARGHPIYDGDGTFVRLVGAVLDTTDRHDAADRAEAANALVGLISSASELLSSSLEAEDAVRSLARLVVPALADWSVVSLVDDSGRLADVDSWHRDPTKRELTATFARHRLEGREDEIGSLRTLASREPFLVDSRADQVALRTLRSQPAIDAVRALDLAAAAVFPLLTETGELIGLITLARGTRRPAFSTSEVSATADLCRRAGTALANARSFGREREMSERLQRSMLTETLQPAHVEVAVRYLPAAKAVQVGGDWYDAFEQPDGATMLVVGDVVGHDSVAAAVMGQLRSILRGVAVSNGTGPAQLLGDLDRILVTLRMRTTATVLVVRVEGEPGSGAATLRWSSAGHPPPLLAHPDGQVTVLDAHDLMLGVDPAHARQDHTLRLPPGATLFLYTDGLVERRGEDIDDSVERLRSAVQQLGSLPLEASVDRLLGDLLPGEVEDDVVVLAMRLAAADSTCRSAERVAYSEPPSSGETES